eukprot:CCRYP_004823-RA/>CCRYP_004823-RA protein AED:0.07 eAED:0.07 QI:200/1/1/1/0.87/0.77/9/1212/825
MNSITCVFLATTTAVFLLQLHPNNVVDSFVINSRSCTTTANKYKDHGVSRKYQSDYPRDERNRELQLQSHSSVPSPTAAKEIDLALSDEETQQSLDYLAKLIQTHLDNAETAANTSYENSIYDNPATPLAKHRFIDLVTSLKGELILESLFTLLPPPDDERLIQHAIIAMQSLLVYAMQIGVKGTEESQKKMVRHLFRRDDPPPPPPGKAVWVSTWDAEDIRRLKFYRDGELGKRVLAALKRRRTAVGAFDLLVEMGVWDKFEEVSLLRSGFPVRFWDEEEKCSLEAENNNHDPDTILGIRQDLRHHKVYTIDSHSTEDIDDGLSVEVVDELSENKSQKRRLRYWIHIADVDRWAPRESKLLKVAERRGTSLYLPSVTLGMFPRNMASYVMALTSNADKNALSLGVELLDDGSIDAASIMLTPSLIHVDYRLTYDQVDEMLDEGVGYTEEWQVGALLSAATKRREHRVRQGSTEGFVPCPIPKSFLTLIEDEEKEGGYSIELKIETTHNSGLNITAGSTEGGISTHYDPFASPLSSSQLIVTEMMILAGEAIGKWHGLQPMQEDESSTGPFQLPNVLTLPYRRQPAPDYKTRAEEARQADFLFGMNKLYPHAWYCRRFFKPVVVSEEPGPHFGMGLDCYIQWSSPIRRLTDLKVHAALKRYLRRKRVNEMLLHNINIPPEITDIDLGCDISQLRLNGEAPVSKAKIVDPIDYSSGLGMIFAARPIQSSSTNFWLFEYVRRKVDGKETEVMFESIILGCVNQERFQYAVYVYELGLEHRYLSEVGKLEEGERLWLKVVSVNPRLELLTFSLASKSGGIHHSHPTSS